MRALLIPALLTLLLPHLVVAQGPSALIPSTLPACAGQCSVLQQAATGCTPQGGAPVSNQATYQSCFCQSALLPSLNSMTPVQLCSTCSQADMATIQSWYKGLCGKGAGVASLPTSTSSSSSVSSTVSSTSTGNATPSTSQQSAIQNAQGNNSSGDQASNGPWLRTHYRWLIMLIVIFFGLVVLAVAGFFLHRRYHRRREAAWGPTTGFGGVPANQPNINTWGPGQSVHDLGYTPGSATPVTYSEKGKMRVGSYVGSMSSHGGISEPTPMYGSGRNKSNLRNEIFDDGNRF